MGNQWQEQIAISDGNRFMKHFEDLADAKEEKPGPLSHAFRCSWDVEKWWILHDLALHS